MNKRIKKLIFLIIIILILFVPVLIFFSRPPVLFVTENSFIMLYGEDRFTRDIIISSIRLFRQVKAVVVSNDAGNDIISYAVTEISDNPYSVLFPLRYARSAEIYQERNSSVNVVLLEGRHQAGSSISPSRQNEFFIYRTDIESDFYRAGFAAVSYAEGNNGSIAVFIEPNINAVYGTQVRQAFLRGINEHMNPPQVNFYSYIFDFPDSIVLSCIVLVGAGWELLERRPGIPVILFSWADASMMPSDVVLIIDDSPLAQITQTIAFVSAGEKSGHIKSKFTILDKRNTSGNF